MKKTLGIDIGTNSLGWAIVQDCKIIDGGVIIFKEGILREKGADSAQTPAAKRRVKRLARRTHYRRRMLKQRILRILIKNGMCPLSENELEHWIHNGIYPVDNKAFLNWLKSTIDGNPYVYRAVAASQKVTLEDFGRAIYHLAQRRGFKSSRKDGGGTAEENKNDEGLKGEIAQLEIELRENGKTLGQHLYDLIRSGEKVRKMHLGRQMYMDEFDTICRTQEFSADFTDQLRRELFYQRPLRSQKHLVGKCTLEKKRYRCMIGHPLFEEFRMLSVINNISVIESNGEKRPLTSEEREIAQKCFFVKDKDFDFEKIAKKLSGKNRPKLTFNYRDKQSIATCCVSHSLNDILGEDYRTWKHEYIAEAGKVKTFDYQTVIDAVSFFDDDDKLLHFGICKLGLDEEHAKKLIKLHMPDGYSNYSLYAIKKILVFLRMGFKLPQAVLFAKLPDLLGTERFEQEKDIILSNMTDIISDYQQDKKDFVYIPGKGNVCLSLKERLADYLEYTLHLPTNSYDLLYHHEESGGYQAKDGILPPVNLGMQKNPLCQRCLTVLRRFVNDLRRQNKIDNDTEINIELARSVNDRNTRMAYETYQKNLQEKRKKAIEKINSYNKEPTEDLIRRYLLWEEQNHYCLYTGKTDNNDATVAKKIGITDVLENGFDIEHTVPRSRGGDNSMSNTTLCESHYNRDIKKNRLPSECDNYNDIKNNLRLAGWDTKLEEMQLALDKAKKIARKAPETKRAEARQKMLVLKFEYEYWKKKIEAFDKTADDLGKDFMLRQLNDTGIICKHAVTLLKSVYSKTYARNGQVVEWCRRVWGLQPLFEQKDRTDHTHHLIDAITIAAMDLGTFQRISEAFHEDEEIMYSACFSDNKDAYPWESFPQDAFNFIERVLVKFIPNHNETKQSVHKVHLTTPIKNSDGSIQKKVQSGGDTIRGQLHEETYYGKIKITKSQFEGRKKDSSSEQKETYIVVRKELNGTNFKDESSFDCIIDAQVRAAIKAQYRERKNSDAPLFDENNPYHMITKSGRYDGPVIKKVRCKTNGSNPLCVRRQTFQSSADYKNSFYADIAKDSYYSYAVYKNSADGKRTVKGINLWQYASRKKDPQYISPENRNEDGQFLGYAIPGGLALMYDKSPEELKVLSKLDLSKRLYRIVSYGADRRITFAHHRQARSISDLHDFMVKLDSKSKLGKSSVDFPVPAPLLRLSGTTISEHVLFENVDFKLTMDGNIIFL